MKLSPWYFLTGVALLAALVVFYVQTDDRMVVAGHEHFSSRLELFLRTDAELNQTVLQIRSQLLGDYDSLPRQIDELKRTIGLSPSPEQRGHHRSRC